MEFVINNAMAIKGCIAAAIVDFKDDSILGFSTRNPKFDPVVAAGCYTEMIKTKIAILGHLLKGSAQDEINVLEHQYHVIRVFPQQSIMIFVALDRSAVSAQSARRSLKTFGGVV